MYCVYTVHRQCTVRSLYDFVCVGWLECTLLWTHFLVPFFVVIVQCTFNTSNTLCNTLLPNSQRVHRFNSRIFNFNYSLSPLQKIILFRERREGEQFTERYAMIFTLFGMKEKKKWVVYLRTTPHTHKKEPCAAWTN